MSDTIWVIEQGSYSDYCVVGVYTSRKNAQLVADAINNAGDSYNESTVSAWPLNPAIEELNAGLTQFNIHMLRDGTTELAEPWNVSSYKLAGEIEIWERTKAPAYKGKGIPDIITAIVWAKNLEHAVKIVNEKRVQMIAEGKF